MLDLGRYLLGVTELLLLVGFAWLGASAVRRRWVSELDGAVGHLASAVLAIAGLLWAAEILGSFGAFEAGVYVAAVVVAGGGTWASLRGWRGGGVPRLGCALLRAKGRSDVGDEALPSAASARRGSPHPHATRGRGVDVPVLVALAIAAAAVVLFAAELKPKLSTGMTGFDSTWYHGSFSAGFAQSGDLWSLHFIAPQFLAWFYPANSEVLHGVGMLAFGRDLLSPLLNLGWFLGCLVACWCIGRPYRVAPFSLALGAVALSLPVLSDQAGEARNDIVGIFFLLAGVALAISLRCSFATHYRAKEQRSGEGAPTPGLSCALSVDGEGKAHRSWGGWALVGLAAGLAAGTKLNFLLPAAALVLGFALMAPHGARWRALVIGALGALAGGGYWYLRNLAHAGNPLPWFKHLGPIDLPAPEQALGGREGHSVLGYLTDGSVWSDWLLPGLHDGLTLFWPLLLAAALAGLLLCLGRRSDPALRLAGAAGLAALFAWLIAPTSASGPEGFPRGFESGLRYLAPALALGFAVLPAALLPRVARRRGSPIAEGARSASEHMGEGWRDRTRGPLPLLVALAAIAAIAIGYPIQRHYLENRYENPTFTTPGLNAAFAWAQGIDHARIATTSTRQYPLFGRTLDNEVTYIGEEQPHGGFTAPITCPQWRRLLNEGDYDYVVASRDRIEPGKPPYPPAARWTQAPGTKVVLREPPTIIYKLSRPLDPAACR